MRQHSGKVLREALMAECQKYPQLRTLTAHRTSRLGEIARVSLKMLDRECCDEYTGRYDFLCLQGKCAHKQKGEKTQQGTLGSEYKD